MLVDYRLPSCFRKTDDTFHQFFKAPKILEMPAGQDEIRTPESDIFALGMIFYEVRATVVYHIQVLQ